MNILVCSATEYEIEPFIRHISDIAEQKSFLEYRINGHSIFPLVTGIGSMKMAFAIARYPRINGMQLAINVGLAGSFNEKYNPGTVVEVDRDRLADLGSEDSDGTLLDTYDLELDKPDQFPYKEGWIVNENQSYKLELPRVDGITVNRVSGTPLSIALIKEKYPADVESQEGAGFAYACKMMDLNFLQIRAISNFVVTRNRDGWKVELAIERLNQFLIKEIHKITKDRYS